MRVRYECTTRTQQHTCTSAPAWPCLHHRYAGHPACAALVPYRGRPANAKRHTRHSPLKHTRPTALGLQGRRSHSSPPLYVQGDGNGTCQREFKAQPAQASTSTTNSPKPVNPNREQGTPRDEDDLKPNTTEQGDRPKETKGQGTSEKESRAKDPGRLPVATH